MEDSGIEHPFSSSSSWNAVHSVLLKSQDHVPYMKTLGAMSVVKGDLLES